MRSVSSILVAALLACLPLAAQNSASAAAPIIVHLTHPDGPATVKVNLIFGSVEVKGYSGQDVIVQGSGISASGPTAAPPGMHRINQPGDVIAQESNNVVTIRNSAFGRGDVRLQIQVPAHASLQLHTTNGSITVTGVTGDIEASDMNGTINMNQVGGSIVAHTMNGKIVTSVAQLDPGKPSAFSSMNGDIDLTLPVDVHASLQARDTNGSVFLDDAFAFAPTAVSNPDSSKFLGLSPQALTMAADAARAQAAAGVAEMRAKEAQAKEAQAGSQPPMPAVPPAPAVAKGGKHGLDSTGVSGNLNGGGTPLRIETFSGNVYLRRAK